MKKMSRHRRSALINALVIIGTLGIVLYLGSRDGGLNNAWNTMRSADWRWLLAAVGSWLVFMIFEGMGLHVFFRYQNIKIRFGRFCSRLLRLCPCRSSRPLRLRHCLCSRP